MTSNTMYMDLQVILASQGRKFPPKKDTKPIGSGCGLFTFLLKSLLSLYFSMEISTFSLLFYWNLYSIEITYFSIEISTFLSLFHWNLYFLITFLLKSLLSLSLYFSIEITCFSYWNLSFLITFLLKSLLSCHFSIEILLKSLLFSVKGVYFCEKRCLGSRFLIPFASQMSIGALKRWEEIPLLEGQLDMEMDLLWVTYCPPSEVRDFAWNTTLWIAYCSSYILPLALFAFKEWIVIALAMLIVRSTTFCLGSK